MTAQRPSRLLALLQLTRAGLALTALSNIWLVLWLDRYLNPLHAMRDLWVDLLSTAAVALGTYTFGMTLNDLMDARRDRLIHPDRPLPSGRLSPATAAAIVVGSLLVAIAGSIPLGTHSTFLALATATLILFYNGPGKHVAGLGILLLGIIRALHMLIAAPEIGFLWPAWLALTHVAGVSALCHRLEEKRPPLIGAHVWLLTLGWAFLSLGVIGWMGREGQLTLPNHPWALIWPGAAAVAFLIPLSIILSRSPDPRRAGRTLMKLALAWLILYDASWLASLRLYTPALIHASLLILTLLGTRIPRGFSGNWKPRAGLIRSPNRG